MAGLIHPSEMVPRRTPVFDDLPHEVWYRDRADGREAIWRGNDPDDPDYVFVTYENEVLGAIRRRPVELMQRT